MEEPLNLNCKKPNLGRLLLFMISYCPMFVRAFLDQHRDTQVLSQIICKLTFSTVAESMTLIILPKKAPA